MKHIINYLGALLAVVLIGATFTACSEDDKDSANVGLGIKTFFPTKVVTNQPMTINGSGFADVTKIEFPGDIEVTNFEIVSNEMIRVNAPAGISAEGGKIKVETSGDEAESNQSLTIGHTSVTGFSKQPGDEANGGDLIEVYGSDLEFINKIELLDADGETQFVDHKDFYRKGTSQIMFRVPLKNIFEGTFVGYLHTYDGQKIALPELAYKPAADEGHWEIVKTLIWENPDPDGNGPANWNGVYRFAPETNSTGEEIATIPTDLWEKMKTQKFYMLARGSDWVQMRIVTGWWNNQWPDANDISTGNEMIIDNGDGTYYIEIDLANSALAGAMDAEHLLFTGSGFTPLQLYFQEETWIDGPGMQEVEVPVWTNGGTVGEANWNGVYRFGLEGNDGNNECAATFAQDVWNKLKSETFYVTVKGANPQIRVTTGWWTGSWTGADIQPGNELLTDNGDGTWTLTVNLSSDTELVDLLDAQHLLFTGSGYTVEKIYFVEMQAGGGGSSDIDISSFTLYEDRSANVSWPYYPSWSENSGKIRIMRGMDPAIETLGLTTSSKFIIYKEVGTTGQIQFNDPNWTDLQAGCNDWDGSAETIEVPITETMLKWITGENTDGWSDTALILQGDGLKVTKIVIVK